MTPNEFLNALLESQNLHPDQERVLEQHKKEVTDFLRREFGTAPVIKYAGSREKGTMIRDKYDLDIVCYFPSSDPRSLKDIRKDVSDHLQAKYTVEPKASAERIKSLKGVTAPNGYHIDVVPGRFIEGSKDVFLHVAYGDKERMQTNLKTHIDYIAGSGCVPIIRLVKLWAHRNNIPLKTFLLELFVVRALLTFRNKTNLKEGFLRAMAALRDEFGHIELVDPANTNNVVSRTLSPSEKTNVANAAGAAMAIVEDSDQVGEWQKVFNDGQHNEMRSPISSSAGPAIVSSPRAFTPHAPWCDDHADRSR